MKNKIVLLISFYLFVHVACFAQSKDSISQINDYSNRKQVDISLMLKDNKKSIESTLVIINNKIICKIDDKYFKELDNKNISNLQIILDEKSKSSITKIVIITTK